MDDSRSRAQAVADEPYARWLGVRIETADAGAARVELPYREENSNPGKQVHGGVVASLLAIAARTAALAGADAAEPISAGTLSLNVAYLSSAVGEPIVADARVLRRGKELCYVRSDAAGGQGKPLGTAMVVYRAAPGIDPPSPGAEVDRSGDTIAGVESIGAALAAAPFISGVGMVAEQMKDGRARLRLGLRDSNAGAGGAVHEGVIAAMLDTCGSLAAWSLVKPQRGMRVSTVAIDANFVSPVKDEDLIARAQMVRRMREIFFNRVQIESAGGRLAAYGSVIYRIVLPQ